MKNIKIRFLQKVSALLLTVLLVSQAGAEETIIKEEKLSFEKCLKVISTSEDKLSLAPEIEEISVQKRVAVFTLVDGTLTITCNGEENRVTVSTRAN